MGGQHLAVRVDVNALAVRLLEQFFQVLEVVAGNEDRLSRHRRDADGRGHGVAVGAGVGGVQQGHHLEVHLAAAKGEAQQFLRRPAVGPREVVQRLVDERVDLVALLAQDHRVIGVGRHALEAVGQQFLKTGHVGPQLGQTLVDGEGLALGEHRVHGCAGHEGRRAPRRFDSAPRLAGGLLVRGAGFGLHLLGLLHQANQPLGIEVDVGHGAEEGLQRVAVHRRVLDAQLPGAVGVHGDALGRVQQQVLEHGGLRVLAANSRDGAGGSLGGLLTLIAEHGHCNFPFLLGVRSHCLSVFHRSRRSRPARGYPSAPPAPGPGAPRRRCPRSRALPCARW